MFVLLVAFLFNWIGFCLSFCLTNTIAGRYGAICGFGLSLIKWILIVRVCLFLFFFFSFTSNQAKLLAQLRQFLSYPIGPNM